MGKTVRDSHCDTHTHIIEMKRKPRECFTYLSTLLSNKSKILHEYKGYIFCKLWYKFGYSLENKCIRHSHILILET